ncbi:putative protein arginine methyltransferase [Tieghemostelium lacteum]|uniref:type I protein arginine methyltransferase n=1 Tax=Tieghemostelium lacteum TaxID=361077 RepID=A0A151ZG54_TIELA|nr:putative protein arginine methyltransferase [Tieghemostelium lacteum]|eukprot:KYQ92907.1 putative protein arginine methyltransferase [Tieghemostelium lacteum]
MSTMDIDTDYFDSYFDLNVHELMLKDKPRTLSYKNAIELNSIDFKDKIVLDVGSGTGILSMFAAKAGAKRVYAVEGSLMAGYCELLVRENHLHNIITVLSKRMENVDSEDIPEGKVDIIISEWMGFYLFHESMLNSVIEARDRWLKPNGIMFPSRAELYLQPVNMEPLYQSKVNFWNDVYGFDFSILKGPALERIHGVPLTDYIDKKQLVTEDEGQVTGKLIREFNFSTVTCEELEDIVIDHIKYSFPLNERTKGLKAIQGFCIWFICYFEGSQKTVTLSTAPGDPETHWKQTTIPLPGDIQLQGGEEIICRLQMKQDEDNSRRYVLTLDFPDEDEEEGTTNQDIQVHSIENIDEYQDIEEEKIE